MTLSSWSPFRSFNRSPMLRQGGTEHPLMRLQEEMNQMFQDFMGPHSSMLTSFPSRTGELSAGTFNPRIDVWERDDKIEVSAELPGMTADDIEIKCESDRLRLRGEKTFEKHREEDGVYHSERSYGSFERVIGLPHEVDVKKAEATFKHGVLSVVIPRVKNGSSSRKLKIKSD